MFRLYFLSSDQFTSYTVSSILQGTNHNLFKKLDKTIARGLASYCSKKIDRLLKIHKKEDVSIGSMLDSYLKREIELLTDCTHLKFKSPGGSAQNLFAMSATCDTDYKDTTRQAQAHVT